MDYASLQTTKVAAMRLAHKRILHWAGSVLAIVGIVFVVQRMHDYGSEIDLTRFVATDWYIIAGLSVSYGLANVLLAFAWWHLLVQFGEDISRRWAIRAFGLTQIAKYVPGNIFHLAGRQAVGMAAGIPGLPLAKSAAWEIGLLITAGSLFAILVLPLLLPQIMVGWSTAAFVLMLVLSVFFLRRFIGSSVARAFSLYLIFLLISAGLFVGLVVLLNGNLDLWPDGFVLGGAYVLSWLAGLITPGAPAGVGVREMVLLFLFKNATDGANLLVAIILWRLITVMGDMLFFLASFGIGNKNEKSK